MDWISWNEIQFGAELILFQRRLHQFCYVYKCFMNELNFWKNHFTFKNLFFSFFFEVFGLLDALLIISNCYIQFFRTKICLTEIICIFWSILFHNSSQLNEDNNWFFTINGKILNFLPDFRCFIQFFLNFPYFMPKFSIFWHFPLKNVKFSWIFKCFCIIIDSWGKSNLKKIRIRHSIHWIFNIMIKLCWNSLIFS